MSDAKLNITNSILNKLIKALLLITGLLWIPLNIYNSNLPTSWFLFFTLIGYILLDTLFVTVGLSLFVGKEQTKSKFVRVTTWLLGVALGLHSYILFTEHKYFSATFAEGMNVVMFILGLLVILSFAGFAIYYFIGKRNRN